MLSEIIEKTIKTLPNLPGVYLMHSVDDTVIYVGKAKNLKNRVTQYFRSGKNHTPKVRAMVSNIHHFEYIVTDSELEALVLECTLIKKHMPKYNILLKDDKTYPFIKITGNNEFPKVIMTRKMVNDGGKYFGPYLNSNVARGSIELLRKIFGIYTCNRNFPKDIGKGRPCLYYHMKQCRGICTGAVSAEEYAHIMERVREFLEGNHSSAIKKMEDEMCIASENMEFERAAALRDSIQNLKSISEKQKIVGDLKKEMDYIAYASDAGEHVVQVFFVRGGKLSGRENFRMKNTESESVPEIITQFITQFYANSNQVPFELVVQCEIEDSETLVKWLEAQRGGKVVITVPKRGEKKKMLDMCYANALQSLDTINLTGSRERKIMLEIKELLGLDKMPRLIECYDISHTGGADSVGGMVVYEDTKPKKNRYRRFKIDSAESCDDYGAMSEVIFRRVNRFLEGDEKFTPLPDLILLDGGKGHVSVIRKLLRNLDVSIPVFGLAKDDSHKTKELVGEDEDIAISIRSHLFRFLAGVQEEVHRYAITYHKKLHKKSSVKSVLSDIPGVGEAKRTALLKHFKSVENIKNASVEELCMVKGISERIAEEINGFFQQRS